VVFEVAKSTRISMSGHAAAADLPSISGVSDRAIHRVELGARFRTL